MKKFILLILCILLTGCSYVELNDLAVASAVGIDYKDDEFLITAQIMDVKSSDSGIADQGALIYEAKGKTVASAVRNFSLKYPKNVYFGHLQIGILGKEIVENKMEDVFDYFLRSPEARTSGYVLVSLDKDAKEILNPKNEKEGTFPTEDIKSIITDSTKKNGIGVDYTFEDFYAAYLKKGLTPVMPVISVDEKNITSSSTKILGIAPIEKHKVYPLLKENEAKAFNTINNNYDDIVIDSMYKDKPISSIIYNPKSNINVKFKDNKPIFDINISIETKLTSVNKKIKVDDENVEREIKKSVNKEFRKYIKSLIKYNNTNSTDILGLRNLIYKSFPKKYKKYKKVNLYKESTINININNDIYRHGNIDRGAL